jgi:hypothetical protein
MATGKLALLCVLGLLGGLWIFFSAFKRLRLRRAVAGTPTSKARSAAMGACELKGLARELDLPILGPFSGLPCVWYRWKVEEERSDSKGNRSWHTVDEKNSIEPFLLEDSSGRLRVDPHGAEVEAPKLLSYTSGAFSMASRPSGPQAAGWLNFGRRRLSEWRIEQAMPVYALGVLRPGSTLPGQAPDPVLSQGRVGEPFFISTSSEAEVLSELVWSVWGRMLLGAALGVASAAGLGRLFFGI